MTRSSDMARVEAALLTRIIALRGRDVAVLFSDQCAVTMPLRDGATTLTFGEPQTSQVSECDQRIVVWSVTEASLTKENVSVWIDFVIVTADHAGRRAIYKEN